MKLSHSGVYVALRRALVVIGYIRGGSRTCGSVYDDLNKAAGLGIPIGRGVATFIVCRNPEGLKVRVRLSAAALCWWCQDGLDICAVGTPVIVDSYDMHRAISEGRNEALRYIDLSPRVSDTASGNFFGGPRADALQGYPMNGGNAFFREQTRGAIDQFLRDIDARWDADSANYYLHILARVLQD